MKPPRSLPACLALALAATSGLRAEEASPEIAALAEAAADFVTAYNAKDATALTALFTEDAELSDLRATDLTTGRAGIRARYEEIFAAPDAPRIAVEVDSVRLVAPGLAIEDGTAHYTPPGDEAPPRSIPYCAVLQKSPDGAWRIASSRDLGDATEAPGRLAALAEALKGDWTCQQDGMRLDLAFGWDGSGKFVVGDMLVTTADAKPLSTSIRIGWDGARETINWWTFDDGGGFAKGEWTPVDDGWLIRSEGSTADGEALSLTQSLVFAGKDAFTWTARDRLADGEKLPDVELRVVRQAPEPAIE
jgi:uncharacterized protein (TIGR02246 family)